MNTTRHPRLVTGLLLSAACLAAPAAHAGSAYAQVGIPGIGIGYAQALNDVVTLRGDFSTLGSHTKNGSQEGINYEGKVKVSRWGLFADYFPLGNGFRVTGGATVNDMSVKLRSNVLAGTPLSIGNATVTADGTERFNADIKFPKVTPYIGIGWGHMDKEPGWGFVGDVGVSIGRAKVTIDTNVIQRSGGAITQADVDRETQELKDGVGKIRVLPQATLGVSYRY
ncbi:MAG: hypothetical protein RJB60_948 [Pseudomonadota bacterium]|jgi:hypothetical protein